MKSFAYFFSEKVTRIVVGFVLLTWLARHLGPEKMGIYSYVEDFVKVFIPIVLFGLDDILVKELIREEDKNKVMSTVLTFRLVLSVVVWVGLSIAIYIIRREASDVILLTVLYGTLVLFRTLDTFFAYFYANLLIRPLIIGRQIAFLLASVLRAAGLWAGMGLAFFLFNNYLQIILERFFVILELRKVFKPKFHFDKQYLISLLPLCLPIALTSFFTLAEAKMGTFFINKFHELNDVGQYGVGRGLLDLWEFFPATLCMTVFPIIVNSKATDPAIYHSKLKKLYSGLFYFGVVFALMLSVSAPMVIKILYGARYEQTVQVLIYGSILSIITFVNLARLKWYILENDTLSWLLICFTTLIFNISFQFYFTPKYGVIGPYFASISAQFAGNILVLMLRKNTRKDLGIVLQGILYPVMYFIGKQDETTK